MRVAILPAGAPLADTTPGDDSRIRELIRNDGHDERAKLVDDLNTVIVEKVERQQGAAPVVPLTSPPLLDIEKPWRAFVQGPRPAREWRRRDS